MVRAGLYTLLFASAIPAVVSAQETVRWQKGTQHSAELYLSGRLAKVVAVDSVLVLALVESNEKPLRVYVAAHNYAARPVNLVPEEFVLEVSSPERAPLAYISPQQIVRDIEKSAKRRMALQALAGTLRSMNGTGTATSSGSFTASDMYGNRVYGSGTGQTTYYDEVRNQALTRANIHLIKNSAEEEKARQITGALLAITLFQGEEIGGTVFFERDKKARQLTLRVPVGRWMVEFPLDVPQD